MQENPIRRVRRTQTWLNCMQYKRLNPHTTRRLNNTRLLWHRRRQHFFNQPNNHLKRHTSSYLTNRYRTRTRSKYAYQLHKRWSWILRKLFPSQPNTLPNTNRPRINRNFFSHLYTIRCQSWLIRSILQHRTTQCRRQQTRKYYIRLKLYLKLCQLRHTIRRLPNARRKQSNLKRSRRTHRTPIICRRQYLITRLCPTTRSRLWTGMQSQTQSQKRCQSRHKQHIFQNKARRT